MRILLTVILAATVFSAAAQTLVMPGDYPDPSVVKIGDTYWASATTSNWAPAFPLLQSTDLVHWQIKGHVFPQLPSWADYYFWAPEIAYENNKVYVYYSAHKRDGNLCVAVASADKPEGPYRDHGPLMCQEVGSIDAFPVRDANGKLFLVWKEDGNSVKKPTPIWAMEMNEERTALVGEKKELFRNDADWEANLVEGVSMIRHGGYFYAFYAGAGCCGRGCSYAMGVARSKNLMGPWEKYEKNPLFTDNETWKCPGHGTPVEKNGKYYLLYHAYNTKGDVYTGRQGVLKEFKFTTDGWIELVAENDDQPAIPAKVHDDFSGKTLSPYWHWSVFQTPAYNLTGGQLTLQAAPGKSGAFLGQRIVAPDYHADVKVLMNQSTAESGIAVLGDEKNLVSLSVTGNKLTVRQLAQDNETIVKETTFKPGAQTYLRVAVTNGKEFTFSYSTNGKSFNAIHEKPVDGFFLPPWDRAVRVVLISRGEPAAKSTFDNFVLEYK